MDLKPIDRMNAIILAKSIQDRGVVLALQGGLGPYVARLASYRIFAMGELQDISGLSEYQIRRAVAPDTVIKARSGVSSRHLDHLLRMVDDKNFTKLHIKHLLEDGATIAAVARITGRSENSLRRWAREE